MIEPATPSQLTVTTTTACNLTCSYCFQNEKGHDRLGASTLRRTVDALLETPHRSVRMNFHGGEPLLEFDAIREAVEYA